jgi:ferredoxin
MIRLLKSVPAGGLTCHQPEVRELLRTVVSIHEHLCNGCGECVPACQEGAIEIIHGKARLVADSLCDGLGACLGSCPQGAIGTEQREAAPFDQEAVRRRIGDLEAPAGRGSELTHWPVQLRLLPADAPALRGARLLVAADCVPVAYRGFHSELLRGHAVVIACPKLDDRRGYVEKLAEMIRHNDPAELTVAHMEVPCCTGILRMVLEARRLAESDLPVDDVSIGIHGQPIERRQILAEPMVSAGDEPACLQITGVE